MEAGWNQSILFDREKEKGTDGIGCSICDGHCTLTSREKIYVQKEEKRKDTSRGNVLCKVKRKVVSVN